jgi:hypothetical protein
MAKNPKQVRQAQKVINLQANASTLTRGALAAVGDFKKKIASAAKNAVAVILRNKGNERYYYGELDNLPNTIIATVDNSGTATACIERLEQFIQADGFILEGLNAVKANSKQSLLAVTAEIVTNVAYLEGYALRLVFNNDGSIRKIYNINVSNLRRVNGGFEFNPLNGELGEDKSETVFYPEFDAERPPAERLQTIKKQIGKHGEQLGEILYVYRKGLGRFYDIYPVPRYYASIEDLVSDGKISRLDLRNIAQGFRTPVIISTGPIDDQNEDEDGNTSQDYFDEALQDFTGEDASPILHLKGNTEEFKPTVTTINIAEILDQTDRASERIAKRVCRVMGVPDVLVSIAKEGQLGNVQELKNTLSLFALSVFKRQELIKEGFDQIKPFLKLEGLPAGADFTLSTLKPFDFIPDSVIAALTPEEQKELFEIDLQSSPAQSVQPTTPEGVPAPGAEANSTLTNLTGRQMQQLLRTVRKFNKDEITYEQAEALLIGGGFAANEAEAAKWLVTKDEEELNPVQ